MRHKAVARRGTHVAISTSEALKRGSGGGVEVAGVGGGCVAERPEAERASERASGVYDHQREAFSVSQMTLELGCRTRPGRSAGLSPDIRPASVLTSRNFQQSSQMINFHFIVTELGRFKSGRPENPREQIPT